MVNDELVTWIKSEEAQGYSEKALTDVLTKKGYSKKDIRETFDSFGKKKLPFSVLLTLFFGFNAVTMLLVTIVLAATLLTGLGELWGVILLTATGALMGFYIYYVNKKLDVEEKYGALLGIFSPGFTLLLLTIVLTVLQKFLQQLKAFAGPESNAEIGGLASMVLEALGSGVPDPAILGILFYLFCNLFMIIAIIKSKKYTVLWWYVIAPVVFMGAWIIGTLFTSSILTPMMAGG